MFICLAGCVTTLRLGIGREVLALAVAAWFTTLVSFATVVCTSESQFNRGDCLFSYFDVSGISGDDDLAALAGTSFSAGPGFIAMLLAWLSTMTMMCIVKRNLGKGNDDRTLLDQQFVSSSSVSVSTKHPDDTRLSN